MCYDVDSVLYQTATILAQISLRLKCHQLRFLSGSNDLSLGLSQVAMT